MFQTKSSVPQIQKKSLQPVANVAPRISFESNEFQNFVSRRVCLKRETWSILWVHLLGLTHLYSTHRTVTFIVPPQIEPSPLQVGIEPH